MLDGCDLDAAVICTPTSLHFDQVLACWSKGLPVLCEKPLAARREEIAELSDRAPMSPLLSIAYQRRSWSVYRTLRREVRSGRWGRVTAVTSVNAEAWQPTIAGTWRDDLEVNPGGFIGDAGSHKIDAIFYTTGLRAVNVDAASWRCGSRVDIVTNVLAVLEGDVPLTMTFAGNAHAFQEDLHIHCERADLLLRNGVLTVAHEGRIQPIEPLEPQAEAVSAFLDLLDGVSENHAPADCALPVHDFTRAVLQSAELRQPIALR